MCCKISFAICLLVLYYNINNSYYYLYICWGSTPTRDAIYDIDKSCQSKYNIQMARSTTPRVIKNKPVVPEDTCQYIDMVQELIDKIADQENALWRSEQATLAKALLEYIRESNQKLRVSGKFWYERCKNKGDV